MWKPLTEAATGKRVKWLSCSPWEVAKEAIYFQFPFKMKYGLHYHCLGCTYSVNKDFLSSMWQHLPWSHSSKKESHSTERVFLWQVSTAEGPDSRYPLVLNALGARVFPIFHLLISGWWCLLSGRQSRPISPMFSLLLVKTQSRQMLLRSHRCSLCAQHMCLGLGKPQRNGSTRTQSPSSFLSLFFYWKLHQRKQKFKPNIHWSTESPRSGKMAAIRIVVQMENIKKNHSSTDLSKTFWDISTQMPI